MITFAELARQNTGSSMLDSGKYYGYQYEKPVPDYDIKLDGSWGASINTIKFLEHNLEIIPELTEICDEAEGYWAEKILNELGVEIFDIEGVGLKKVGQFNTSNYENDLDQVFQATILSDSDEWYYSDNTILLLQTHNGCDVRGGYSKTVACKLIGEYFMFDRVEFSLHDMDDNYLWDDHYESFYDLEGDCEILEDESTEDYYIVVKDDVKYKAYPYCSGLDG